MDRWIDRSKAMILKHFHTVTHMTTEMFQVPPPLTSNHNERDRDCDPPETCLQLPWGSHPSGWGLVE